MAKCLEVSDNFQDLKIFYQEETAIIEPDVACGHCKKELNNPYLLCCLHSVCAECLPNMVVENVRLKCSQCGDTSTSWNDGKMSESECQVDSVHCFPVPNAPLARYIEGIKIVQKVITNVNVPCDNKRCRKNGSPATVFCANCNKFFCEVCHGGHELMDEYENHAIKSLQEIRTLGSPCIEQLFIRKSDTPTCPYHCGEALKYVCGECAALLCQVCTVVKDPTAHPHKPQYLDKALLDSYCHAISVTKHTVAAILDNSSTARERATAKIVEVDIALETALEEVDLAFDNIVQAVQRRKDELRQEIQSIASNKKETIGEAVRMLDTEKHSLACCHFALSVLDSHSSGYDALTTSLNVSKMQASLVSHYLLQNWTLPLSTEVGFMSSNTMKVMANIENFGILESGAHPVNCTVEPNPEGVRPKGSDPVTLSVTTYDRENIRCKRGGDNVEAFLHPKSPIPGPAIKARVVDDKNGRYTISFPTAYPGECDLYIQVNGSDIRGSPFTLIVQHSFEFPTLAKNVHTLGIAHTYLPLPQGAGGPWGVAVGPNGKIFISDYTRHEIHVFDDQRRYLTSFGGVGGSNGRLSSPTGVAVDDQCFVHVSNSGNDRIEVFTSDGQFIRQIGRRMLRQPYDVAIHKAIIYVTDSGNNRIVVFNLKGQIMQTIGDQGSSPGSFLSPASLALSPYGTIYIADMNNHRVQVFNTDGMFMTEFGVGRLKHPLSIIITADSHVLVADYGSNRIFVFDLMGELLDCFKVPGTPYGMAIDTSGSLIVALRNSRQVVVY